MGVKKSCRGVVYCCFFRAITKRQCSVVHAYRHNLVFSQHVLVNVVTSRSGHNGGCKIENEGVSVVAPNHSTMSVVLFL